MPISLHAQVSGRCATDAASLLNRSTSTPTNLWEWLKLVKIDRHVDLHGWDRIGPAFAPQLRYSFVGTMQQRLYRQVMAKICNISRSVHQLIAIIPFSLISLCTGPIFSSTHLVTLGRFLCGLLFSLSPFQIGKAHQLAILTFLLSSWSWTHYIVRFCRRSFNSQHSCLLEEIFKIFSIASQSILTFSWPSAISPLPSISYYPLQTWTVHPRNKRRISPVVTMYSTSIFLPKIRLGPIISKRRHIDCTETLPVMKRSGK